jgi:Uma2 family endonuclease
MTTLRWTSEDLERIPDDGRRYEIVDGELYVSTQPNLNHQLTCALIWQQLHIWSRQRKAGKAYITPGLIFTEDNDVVPDVAWISHERLAIGQQPDGHLHIAPELVVEILSPGTANARRDREVKRKLYARQGVLEYWIVNWQERYVEVYRHESTELKLAQTLYKNDMLQSPHLPGFSCQINRFFDDME